MPTDLSPYLNRTGLITTGKLAFAVKILDSKPGYGHTRLKITPVAGQGTAWVNLESVQLDNPEPASQPLTSLRRY